jgi:hypothetical protein
VGSEMCIRDRNETAAREVDLFFGDNQSQIVYKNTSIMEVYPDYRLEQFNHQNNIHYSLLWLNTNIYKLHIDHVTKNDFSVSVPETYKKSILLICHIGNFDVFEKIRHYISFVYSVRNLYNVDLFFNLVEGLTSNNLSKLKMYYPEANVVISENYGFDIGSFFHILNIIKERNLKYDYVLKIHTKTDDAKRFNILDRIVSSRDRILSILKMLDENPNIGCASSVGSFQTDDFVERTRNKNHLNTLLSSFGMRSNNNMPFPGGCMFWIRFDVLESTYMKFDLLKICQSLNTHHTFDYNWFYFSYYSTVINLKTPFELYKFYQ